MFGLKRDEVTGGARKLHNEELHKLYPSPSISRMIKSKKMRWERHVERKGVREIHMLFPGKPEGRRPLGRTGLRWVDNIKMEFEEIDGVVWNELIWLRIETSGRLL
jgi:hypothetical protein